jgi:hypothetical protein
MHRRMTDGRDRVPADTHRHRKRRRSGYRRDYVRRNRRQLHGRRLREESNGHAGAGRNNLAFI